MNNIKFYFADCYRKKCIWNHLEENWVVQTKRDKRTILKLLKSNNFSVQNDKLKNALQYLDKNYYNYESSIKNS